MAGFNVPTYQPQVEPRQATPLEVPNLSTPSPSTFGAGVAEKVQQTGQIISQQGDRLSQHMIELARTKQEAEILERHTQFMNDAQNLTEGLYERTLGNAEGVTVDYDKGIDKFKQKQLDGFDNPYAAEKLQKQMDETGTTYRRFVIRHEASQADEYTKVQLKNNLKQREVLASNIQDPKELRDQILSAQQINYADMRNRGLNDPASLEDGKNEVATNMIVSAISGTIHTDPDQSQRLFDQMKDEIPNKVIQQKIYEAIQQAKDQNKIHKAMFTLNSYNDAESELAGKIANGDLNQLDLDKMKPNVTDDFYKVASLSLQNKSGLKDNDPSAQGVQMLLLRSFINASSNGDPDKRTAAIMKYRKNVLALQTKLSPNQFQKLLGYASPDFVAKIQTKPGWLESLKAGMDAIENHYKSFMSGSSGQAVMNFFDGATHDSVGPDDVPTVAQKAIRPAILSENPSLVLHPDLSNNTASKDGGVKQVFAAPTSLKPDQSIKNPNVGPLGAETTKNGVVYVWSPKDKKYHPKAQKAKK